MPAVCRELNTSGMLAYMRLQASGPLRNREVLARHLLEVGEVVDDPTDDTEAWANDRSGGTWTDW